jgi:hypothetical protein
VSNWSADTTLPQIHNPLKVTRIIYDATGTTDNTSGILKATSNEYPNIEGKVTIILTGPLTTITSAITRDRNGNGLLDGIDLVFSKKITISDAFDLSNLHICTDDPCYVIDSIYSTTGSADSVWHVAFKEIEPTKPQTNWTLKVSLDSEDSLQVKKVTNLPTTDGAGPVIWSVTKQIVDLEDRTKDVITIVFSEPVVRTVDGSPLSTADAPWKTFYVWELNTNPNDPNMYVRVDSILIGINNMKYLNNSTIQFITSNGNDISSKNFISLNDTTPYVKDGSGNVPIIKNKPAIVLIINSKLPDLRSVPNPATPTFRRVTAGTFNIVHEPKGRTWVRTDGGGTVLTFPIVVPNLGEHVKLRCRAKIHDLAGNLVQSSVSEDLLKTIPSAVIGYVTKYDIDLYWNGSNAEGMKVAPGVYKAVVYLEYYGASSGSSKKYKDTRMTCTVGIAR